VLPQWKPSTLHIPSRVIAPYFLQPLLSVHNAKHFISSLAFLFGDILEFYSTTFASDTVFWSLNVDVISYLYTMGQSTSQMGQGTLAHLRSHQHHHHHDHDVVDENTSLLDQARRESQNVRKRSSVVRSANLNEMGEENRTLAARHGGSMFRAVDYGQNSSRAENSVDDRSANPSAELPIYGTIHSIRRDVVRAIGIYCVPSRIENCYWINHNTVWESY